MEGPGRAALSGAPSLSSLPLGLQGSPRLVPGYTVEASGGRLGLWQVALEDGGREVQRTFEVLYLDERLRIARFQPDDDREPQLFVFKRAGAATEEEEDEEEDEVAVRRVGAHA